MEQREQKIIIKGRQEYHVESVIQHGSGSNHYLVVGQDKKEKFALRIIKNYRKEGENELNTYCEKEIAYLRMCIEQKKKHENIVNCVDLIHNEDQLETYVIEDYCNYGNLFNYIDSNFRIDQLKVFLNSLQIAKGIQFLHNQSINHRNLKPEVILLNINNEGDDVTFKITDFALSTDEQQSSSILGTINYIAPEILKSQKYGKAVDIWSYGCMIYELAFHKQLFQENTIQQIAKKIHNFKTLDEIDKENQQSKIYPIIKECLNVNPDQRIQINEVIFMLQDSIKELLHPINSQLSQERKQIENSISSNTHNHYNKQKKRDYQFSDYKKLIDQLSQGTQITPQNEGFFQKWIKTLIQPTHFILKDSIYTQESTTPDSFSLNLFHFLMSGQLLASLQNLESLIQLQDKNDYMDSFQILVFELLELSIALEKKEEKKMFHEFQQALIQLSKIKDFYFRINSYLLWLKDYNFLQQAIKLTASMYQNLFLSNKRQLSSINIIIQQVGDDLATFTEQCGLLECIIVCDQETQSKFIVMQYSFLKMLFSMDYIYSNKQQSSQLSQLQSQSSKIIKEQSSLSQSNDKLDTLNQSKEVKQLFKQFKSTFIYEGLINSLKKKINSFSFSFYNQDDDFSHLI